MTARPGSRIGQLRRAGASLSPFDYAATAALLAIYAIGTSLDDGPKTDMAFYSAAATVIPSLLIAVAIQGRVLELSRKISFRVRYRTVMLAVVVFAGETGTLMTLRDRRPTGPRTCSSTWLSFRSASCFCISRSSVPSDSRNRRGKTSCERAAAVPRL
jgi:hypothetical protein